MLQTPHGPHAAAAAQPGRAHHLDTPGVHELCHSLPHYVTQHRVWQHRMLTPLGHRAAGPLAMLAVLVDTAWGASMAHWLVKLSACAAMCLIVCQ